MRRFEQRTNETLVAAELFDRTVTVTTTEAEVGFPGPSSRTSRSSSGPP